MCMYAFMCVCLYVCMHAACMHVCMYAYMCAGADVYVCVRLEINHAIVFQRLSYRFVMDKLRTLVCLRACPRLIYTRVSIHVSVCVLLQ
jgi:hypothetical protein